MQTDQSYAYKILEKYSIYDSFIILCSINENRFTLFSDIPAIGHIFYDKKEDALNDFKQLKKELSDYEERNRDAD